MGRLQTLFNTDRRLAIVPNIGPLVMPTTKAQYGQSSHPRPASLFSHNDQQNTWQALAPEGATRGWGGRMGDLLAPAQHPRRVHRRSRPAATPSGWRATACSSTRSASTARRGSARTAAAASTARPTSARRCSASSRAAAAAMCWRPTWPTWRSARSTPRSLLRTALRPASDAAFGTPPASGTYNANNDPKLQYDNPLTGATQLQRARAAAAGRRPHGRRRPERRHRRAAPGLLRQHGRLRHPRPAEPQPRRPDGQAVARAGATSTRRSARSARATTSPPSPPATSAAPSPATATAPTTAGARTTS